MDKKNSNCNFNIKKSNFNKNNFAYKTMYDKTKTK